MVKVTRREIRTDFMPYKIEIEVENIEEEKELNSALVDVRGIIHHYYKPAANNMGMRLFLDDIIARITNK